MSNVEEKRYHWLKLKEDFFEEDAIEWLEEQENGKEYVLFYLKLCLKSIKSNGILIRRVGTMLVPYDTHKLSEMTKTDFDTVVVAMKLFREIGLVEIQDSGEIYLTELNEMIGSEAKSTSRSRLCRERKRYESEMIGTLQCNTDATLVQHNCNADATLTQQNCNTDIDIDIDIEKELELDIDIDNNIEQNAQKKETYAEAFDKLWESYPRKIGKKRAFEAYKRAIKSGTTDEVIADGIERYRQYVESRKFEEKYIKQGSTWFAGECWNDEYDISTHQLTAEEERDYQELWGG